MYDVAQGDLTALSARDLGLLLNEIDSDMELIAPQQVEAEKALAKAETILLYDSENKSAKADRIRERAALKALGHQARALRMRQSRIQSILKSLAMTGGL
jgi:hypothetical protein